MSDVQQEQPEAKMKVWQPEGFAGVEIEKFDGVLEYIAPKGRLRFYDLTVSMNVHNTVRIDYRGEKHTIAPHDKLLYLQHPGELVPLSYSSDLPHSAWTVRLYEEYVPALLTNLAIKQEGFTFPEMLAPASMNDTLAKLTTEAVLAFDTPASTVGT